MNSPNSPRYKNRKKPPLRNPLPVQEIAIPYAEVNPRPQNVRQILDKRHHNRALTDGVNSLNAGQSGQANHQDTNWPTLPEPRTTYQTSSENTPTKVMNKLDPEASGGKPLEKVERIEGVKKHTNGRKSKGSKVNPNWNRFNHKRIPVIPRPATAKKKSAGVDRIPEIKLTSKMQDYGIEVLKKPEPLEFWKMGPRVTGPSNDRKLELTRVSKTDADIRNAGLRDLQDKAALAHLMNSDQTIEVEYHQTGVESTDSSDSSEDDSEEHLGFRARPPNWSTIDDPSNPSLIRSYKHDLPKLSTSVFELDPADLEYLRKNKPDISVLFSNEKFIADDHSKIERLRDWMSESELKLVLKGERDGEPSVTAVTVDLPEPEAESFQKMKMPRAKEQTKLDGKRKAEVLVHPNPIAEHIAVTKTPTVKPYPNRMSQKGKLEPVKEHVFISKKTNVKDLPVKQHVIPPKLQPNILSAKKPEPMKKPIIVKQTTNIKPSVSTGKVKQISVKQQPVNIKPSGNKVLHPVKPQPMKVPKIDEKAPQAMKHHEAEKLPPREEQRIILLKQQFKKKLLKKELPLKDRREMEKFIDYRLNDLKKDLVLNLMGKGKVLNPGLEESSDSSNTTSEEAALLLLRQQNGTEIHVPQLKIVPGISVAIKEGPMANVNQPPAKPAAPGISAIPTVAQVAPTLVAFKLPPKSPVTSHFPYYKWRPTYPVQVYELNIPNVQPRPKIPVKMVKRLQRPPTVKFVCSNCKNPILEKEEKKTIEKYWEEMESLQESIAISKANIRSYAIEYKVRLREHFQLKSIVAEREPILDSQFDCVKNHLDVFHEKQKEVEKLEDEVDVMKVELAKYWKEDGARPWSTENVQNSINEKLCVDTSNDVTTLLQAKELTQEMLTADPDEWSVDMYTESVIDIFDLMRPAKPQQLLKGSGRVLSLQNVLRLNKSQIIQKINGKKDSRSGSGPSNGRPISRKLGNFSLCVNEPQAIVDECEAIVEERQEILDKHQEIVDECKAIVEERQEILDKHQEIVDECEAIVEERQEILDKHQEIVDKRKEIVDECQAIVNESQALVDESQGILDESKATVKKKKRVGSKVNPRFRYN